MSVRPPAKNPCGSCPYRRDVPSGVWSEDEYAKLPEFDGETHEQRAAIFECHQQDGRLCAGWVGCHDMTESMGLRVATLIGTIDPSDVDEILDYESSVPLFSSGAEAAAHGLAQVFTPGDDARKVIAKLTRKIERPME